MPSPRAARVVALLLVLPTLAGCGRGESAAPAAAADAAAPPPASAPAPAAAPAPASAGTVTLALRGDGVNVTGEGQAPRCASPAVLVPAPGKGVYYEGTVQGHTVAMGDMEQRRAGAQQMFRAATGTGWSVTINAPGKSYLVELDSSATVQVSDDFKTAELRATVKPVGEAALYAVEATFRCR